MLPILNGLNLRLRNVLLIRITNGRVRLLTRAILRHRMLTIHTTRFIGRFRTNTQHISFRHSKILKVRGVPVQLMPIMNQGLTMHLRINLGLYRFLLYLLRFLIRNVGLLLRAQNFPSRIILFLTRLTFLFLLFALPFQGIISGITLILLMLSRRNNILLSRLRFPISVTRLATGLLRAFNIDSLQIRFLLRLTLMFNFLRNSTLLLFLVLRASTTNLYLLLIYSILLRPIPFLLRLIRLLTFFTIRIIRFAIGFLRFYNSTLLFLFRFPRFNDAFNFHLLLPIIRIRRVLLMLLFRFLRLMFLRNCRIFLFLSTQLMFNFRLLFRNLFLLLRARNFDLGFHRSLSTLIVFHLVIISKTSITLSILRKSKSTMRQHALICGLQQRINLPRSKLITRLASIFFPSFLILFRPTLRNTLTIFRRNLRFIRAQTRLRILNLRLRRYLIFLLRSLLRLFFPLRHRFLSSRLNIISTILLTRIRANMQLSTIFRLLLLNFRRDLLTTRLRLMIRNNRFILLTTALQVRLLKRLFMFLMGHFNDHFILATNFFSTNVRHIIRSVGLLSFNLISTIPLLIRTLSRQLMLNESFYMIQNGSTLLFLRSLLLILPLLLTNQALRSFFCLTTNVFLFLLLYLLRLVIRSNRYLLRLITTLTQLFLRLLATNRRNNAYLLDLILLFLNLKRLTFNGTMNDNRFTTALRRNNLLT